MLDHFANFIASLHSFSVALVPMDRVISSGRLLLRGWKRGSSDGWLVCVHNGTDHFVLFLTIGDAFILSSHFYYCSTGVTDAHRCSCCRWARGNSTMGYVTVTCIYAEFYVYIYIQWGCTEVSVVWREQQRVVSNIETLIIFASPVLVNSTNLDVSNLSIEQVVMS